MEFDLNLLFDAHCAQSLTFLHSILHLTLLLCLIPDEDAKVKAQLEQANKTLSRELEEVKSTLSQTEQTLKAVEEEKTTYHDQIIKTSNTLMSSVKGLLAVLKKVNHL